MVTFDVWKGLLFTSFLMIVVLLIVISKMKARSLKMQTLYGATKKELYSTQKEVKFLKQKLENLNGMLSVYETNENEDKWKKENTFMESKVVLTFQEYANVGKKPSASEWKDLQKLIEANLPAFWQRMSLFDGILDDEFRICLLTRLSFSLLRLRVFWVFQSRVLPISVRN